MRSDHRTAMLGAEGRKKIAEIAMIARHRRDIVSYGVDPHALSFEVNKDGFQAVNMECAVRVFTKKNPDKPVTTEAEKMGGAMNADAYAKIMKGFFPCRDQLSLKPGDYLLRLGVRDNSNGLIGTANASLTIPEDSSSAFSQRLRD